MVSHSFDPGDVGDPYPARIRLTGRRVGFSEPRTAADEFVQEDTIDLVRPGSGPVSITSWVYGLTPGEWTVGAELIGPDDARSGGRRDEAQPISPTVWSWRRWALSGGSPAPVKTRWALLAPLTTMPGVLPGIWPVLGILGIIVALGTQAAILAHERAIVDRPVLASLVALAAGLLGAKLLYAFLHPRSWRQAIVGGWAVDGFLVVAPVVAITTLLASGQPVGQVLDAVTPGLFFAVAIGRVGCFFAGCCAGRTTRSRWGVWSSDRRIGARRIPAQLFESGAGLAIGLTSLLLILNHTPRFDGAHFAGALVGYLIVRQALLRVRAERRDFSWRRRAPAISNWA